MHLYKKPKGAEGDAADDGGGGAGLGGVREGLGGLVGVGGIVLGDVAYGAARGKAAEDGDEYANPAGALHVLHDVPGEGDAEHGAEPPIHLLGKVMATIIAVSSCFQPIGQAIYGELFENLETISWVIMVGAAIVSFGVSILSKRIFYRLEKGE